MQRLAEGRVTEGRDLASARVRGADGLVRDRRDASWHGRGQGGGEPGCVDRGVDAADHSHAERATDEPGGVVDG